MASKINSRKGIVMTKKEKIIAVCFVCSYIMLIGSAIYTICQNKPEGYIFNIEKILN